MKGDSNKPADDLVHDVEVQVTRNNVSPGTRSSNTMSYGGVSAASATATDKGAQNRVGMEKCSLLPLSGRALSFSTGKL